MFLQVKDEFAPGMTILSPAKGSYCAKSVIVTGTVSDLSTDSNITGELSSLSYEILSADIAEEILFDEEGSFSFNFSTITLGSTFVLKITAIDWNENIQTASITLNLMEGNNIPSFSAVPGNIQVTLTWDEVPLSIGYSLLYSTNGTIPSESYGLRLDDVVSPLILSNLTNGSMYVFILQSHLADGDADLSDTIRSIPLSSATLTPTVSSEYQSIRVTWPSIPATDSFEVWRSADSTGTFTLIASNESSNGFIDTRVSPLQHYFYKIKPSLEGSLTSSSVAGSPGVFYSSEITRIGENSIPWVGYGLTARENYVYVADGSYGLRTFDVTDRYKPILVDTYNPGTVNEVSLYGNYAYIAAGLDGVIIMDVTNPSILTAVGSITGLNALDLIINRSRLLVAASTDGLYVYDPADGDYVYFSSQTKGLTVIFSTLPTKPTVDGAVTLSGNVQGIYKSGEYIYRALAGSVDTSGDTYKIDVQSQQNHTWLERLSHFTVDQSMYRETIALL